MCNLVSVAEEINALIAAFDDAHSALKSEKLGLEADVKAGEMRLLVGFQELQLLREFDKRESVLLQKRQAKMDDKQVRGPVGWRKATVRGGQRMDFRERFAFGSAVSGAIMQRPCKHGPASLGWAYLSRSARSVQVCRRRFTSLYLAPS